jgi:AcrR family transcriptional regulator
MTLDHEGRALNAINPAVRRRNNAEDTRRKVLDVVLQTVIEIGYYKASSNEIARRAGVTWGTIQHLFGSRDQLMLDVVNYVAGKMEALVAAAKVEGETLEERLECILDVLAESYDGDIYLVQMQILLELSANPRMSALAEQVIDRENGGTFDRLAQPLVAKAIGEAAANSDLVYYVFLNFRGFLISSALARRIAKLPEGALKKPMGGKNGGYGEAVQRKLLVQGVAATIRAEAKERGIKIV